MLKKIVILDAGTFYGHPTFEESLASLGDLKVYQSTTNQEIGERIKNANIVLTNKVVLDKVMIQNANKLELVCVMATGTNNIDLEAAKERNIVVKNAKGYSTNSVAQTTFAMALQLIMNLKSHHDYVNNGYKSNPFFTHLEPGFSELSGKTWGIIGLGTIGKKVAEIAEAFGCNLIYHSPSGKNLEANYVHKSLIDLLKESDFISVHTPLNENSHNLLNYNNLKFSKSSCILINVARGGIIDESGLKQILDEDLIFGAASDVYSLEPILPDNPLLTVRNKHKLLLTPHIAWGSKEARQKLMDMTRQNIVEYLNSGK